MVVGSESRSNCRTVALAPTLEDTDRHPDSHTGRCSNDRRTDRSYPHEPREHRPPPQQLRPAHESTDRRPSCCAHESTDLDSSKTTTKAAAILAVLQ
jgi:hypothetical protein